MTTIQPTGRRGAAAAHRLTADATARLSELGYPAGSMTLAMRLLLLTQPSPDPLGGDPQILHREV